MAKDGREMKSHFMGRQVAFTPLLLTFAVLAFSSGCQGNIDPGGLELMPDGGVDVTTYDNLEITGTVSVDGGEPVTGPLDLLRLQSTLLALCYDELVQDPVTGLERDNAVAEVCNDHGTFHDFQNENRCHGVICAQQLYLCLGLKNQELAETVEPITFSSRPFTIQQGYINPDGSYYLWFQNNGQFSRDPERTYTIPPQEPANRTLLHRAAVYSFTEAAVKSVLATDPVKMCSWRKYDAPLIDEDYVLFNTVSERGENTIASSADLLMSGMYETLQRLEEATQNCVENERSVAATIPGRIGDQHEQKILRWHGEVNSEASAIALIAGRNRLDEVREAIPPVLIDGQRASTRRAIALLRAAAVNIDEPRTDDQILSDVAKVLNPLDPATGIVLTPEDVLNSAETSRPDFVLARRYLLEERDVLGRVVRQIPGSSGVPRYTGFEEPVGILSAERIMAKISGGTRNLLSYIHEFNAWGNYGVKVSANNSAGPWDKAQQYRADLLWFDNNDYLYAQAELGPYKGPVVFSVYLHHYDSSLNGTLKLNLDCGVLYERTVSPNTTWARFEVLATSCTNNLVTAKISYAGTSDNVTAWGAQLEYGLEAGLLDRGANNPPTILDRSYIEIGTRNAIDSLGQAAIRLRQTLNAETECGIQEEDCEQYHSIAQQVYEQARQTGVGDQTPPNGGGLRTLWDNNCGDGEDWLFVETCGIAPELTTENISFYLVRGEAGLECIRNGPDTEAAICNDEKGYVIVAEPEDFTVRAGGPDDPPGNCAQTEIDICTSELIRYYLIGVLNLDLEVEAWHGPFAISSHTNTCGTTYVPNTPEPWQPQLPQLDPEDVSTTEVSACNNDILGGYVPPLENELTEDSDPYENSWRHYLDVARRSAQEADVLCQQMIEEGLEMDTRSEAARIELMSICGASVDYIPDTWGEEGPGDFCDSEAVNVERLSTCIACNVDSPLNRVPYVSLGNNLCIYVHEDFGPCMCDPDDSGCTNDVGCPLVPMPADGAAFSDEECGTLITGQNMVLSVTEWNATHSPGTYPYTFRYIDESLGLFEVPPVLTDRGVNCEDLHRLRWRIECGYIGQEDAINELRAIDWIEPNNLGNIARSLSLEQRYPHHYLLTRGGEILASTIGEYPLTYPWREEYVGGAHSCAPTENPNNFLDSFVSRDVYLAPLENPEGYGPLVESERYALAYGNLANYRVAYDDPADCSGHDDEYACLWAQLFDISGRQRVYWAEHLAWAMTYLNALGGIEQSNSIALEIVDDGQVLSHHQPTVGAYGEDAIAGLPLVQVQDYTYTDGEANEFYPGYNAIYVECCDSRWGTPGSGPCAGFEGRYPGQDPCVGWNYRDFIDNESAYRTRASQNSEMYPRASNEMWDWAVFADLANVGNTNLIDLESGAAGGFDRGFYNTIMGYYDDNNELCSRRPMVSAFPWARWTSWPFEPCLYPGSGDCCYRAPDSDLVVEIIETPWSSPYADEIERGLDDAHFAGLWNALELACWVQERGGGICPDSVEVTDVEDLNNAANYLECMAMDIHSDMSRQYVAGLPQVILDRFRHEGTESYYPSFGGQQLEAVLQVSQALEQIASSVGAIEHTLNMASADVRVAQAELRVYNLQHERALAELLERQIHAIIDIAKAVGSAMSGGLKGVMFGGGAMTIGAYVADALVIAQFNALYAQLEEMTLDAETNMVVGNLTRALGSRLDEVLASRAIIINSYEEIQRGLNRIDQNEANARRLLSNVAMSDSEPVGRAWNVNTVVRRRYNTTRARYEDAAERARRAAFLARRAIEFRLGVSMEDIEEPMSLVGPPSEWVNELCTLGGCDYDDVRNGGVDPGPSDAGPSAEDVPDAYERYFIGDYVTRLENFVESYSIDYPFSDSDDVSPISLRELVASQGLHCEAEGGSPNLLFYSDDIAGITYSDEGGPTGIWNEWYRTGCEEYPDSTLEEPHYDECLSVDVENTDSRAYYCEGEFCFTAELIEDTDISTETPRPYGARSSGGIAQKIEVDPGIYLLSYWVRDGRGRSQSTNYRVRVVDEESRTVLREHDDEPQYAGADEWKQVFMYFEVAPGQQKIEVQFFPSAADCDVVDAACTSGDPACTIENSSCNHDLGGTSPELGSILLAGVQVIAASDTDGAPGCTATDVAALPFDVPGDPAFRETYTWGDRCYMPREYFRTDETRDTLVACHDPSFMDIQEAFTRVCEDRDGNVCDPNFDYECWCSRIIAFPLVLEQIENGEVFQSRMLATHNYNYRQGRLAVNIVGSNVIQCAPGAPDSCYGDGSIQYSLEHSGSDTPVRNWTGDTVLFDMPTGRIQRGRALASEVVITNPMSTSQRGMVEDFWREELRGRPLQGTYVLRIWEDGVLQWQNVEDVQLVFDYRYWTRFGD